MRIFKWVVPLAVMASLVSLPVHADGTATVVVVTHLDIIPDFAAQAQPLIEQFVVDSRNDPGVKRFTMISWTPTTNHFQLIEVFRDMKAFDQHVSAEHTIEFRDQLQPFIGAPNDERLYSNQP